ncbi:MAG: hypothetical protein HKM95_05300 [Inquilinus sp.]|nr:hypothetical protein [Inquilinus sp.]
MTEIEKLRKIVQLAVKSDEPRQDLIDQLLHHIAAGDSVAFIETYDDEQPTSGEMLRVISRYSKALRALRAK